MPTSYHAAHDRYDRLKEQKQRAWERAERLKADYEAAYADYLAISQQEHDAMIAAGSVNQELRAAGRRPPPRKGVRGLVSRYLGR